MLNSISHETFESHSSFEKKIAKENDDCDVMENSVEENIQEMDLHCAYEVAVNENNMSKAEY